MPIILGAVRLSSLAGIQYLGTGADSRSCVDALRRVLACFERPLSVRLLTSGTTHAFLLSFEGEIPLAIKDGFRSGYKGTGPSALADALLVLRACDLDVEEVEVTREVLERLSASALTHTDLQAIECSAVVRPMRWYDYVYAVYGSKSKDSSVWSKLKKVMPYAIIDHRILDLAFDFETAPDRVLLDGFRRLEDRIRERTGLAEHGAKLFSQAFAGDASHLTWPAQPSLGDSNGKQMDKGEQAGRAQLFTGAYQTFRNPRAHRMLDVGATELLSQFLVLNALFRLEAEAVERQVTST